ncbi:uncharacterized protein LTR77_009755 [Saxophila tyrrhenica]|uniref:Uncharacterized protein n=1 Tax=Saxophila tyrrhenica TaxID=1690608 RepID=A0AAV9NX42_9PEZI|nr:hypothetical protein LTR77_009755 [Saxophila tyrrhenica]
MASNTVRRSSRLNPYDSNGREYLAGQLGCSRHDLEAWITSPTVQPHLRLWYQTCVSGARRFNDAIGWINSGENGYYYNPDGLDDDLLLMCLCEGSNITSSNEPGSALGLDTASYANTTAKTDDWNTQELWARTAWRIVQANNGQGQMFAELIEKHPVARYAFVIDLLCLAFHSIAFRGRASAYEGLINGVGVPDSSSPSSKTKGQAEVGVEEISRSGEGKEGSDAASATSQSSEDADMETDDHSSDGDFSDGTDATTVMAPSPERSTKNQG